MREEILNFLSALGVPGVDSGVLDTLCSTACSQLNFMLADGVKPEDCAEAYVPAAALLVMEWLQTAKGLDGVTSLSAGDMTVRRVSGGKTGLQRAIELMGPWLKDRSFAFMGVDG